MEAIGYIVLAGALGVGLFIYERWGLRLGGVLVLPLVVAYALYDPKILPAFLGAVIITYGAGRLIHHHTLLYGRRLLYAYLLIGLAAGGVILSLLDPTRQTIALAILPGIVAFNLHREARPARSLGTFVAVFVPLYLAAHILLYPFGYAGGLFPHVPALVTVAAAVKAPLLAMVPIGAASALPNPDVLDTGSIGATIAGLLWGDPE